MINKFPYLNKKKKEEVINWLKTQEANCKAEAFRYKACHNTSSEQRALYQASTFAIIIIHLEHHMENEE
jgi:hypothetical protein